MMKRALFALFLLSSGVAWADSWMPPSKEIYYSRERSARLTVTPGSLENAYTYFDDKVNDREPAGVPAGSNEASAVAVLERRSASGRWQTIWKRSLANEVAPVDVVVGHNGQGFATLDNWYSIGQGSNAIAIYGRDGSLVRKFGLQDLFPDWFTAALPRSVSSIHWRGAPRISDDGSELIVPVVQPSKDDISDEAMRKVDLAIRLSDGAPVGLESASWKSALNEAASAARMSCVSEREQIRQWNAPISAPVTSKEQDWHHYLREIQYRTRWSEDSQVVGTTVLRLSNSADFDASVNWLEEALTEAAIIDHELRAIGSPDLARLTLEIERIGRRIRPGRLKGVDLAIVSDAVHSDRIHAALVRSGASLEIIDPKTSYPQIEQRLQDPGDPVTCRAPKPVESQATWWHALPFVTLGAGIFLLRRV